LEAEMNIDEQVAYLMQGTEYGDEGMKQVMANELRLRLARSTARGPAAASVLRV
jgi:hypothetical protein